MFDIVQPCKIRVPEHVRMELAYSKPREGSPFCERSRYCRHGYIYTPRPREGKVDTFLGMWRDLSNPPEQIPKPGHPEAYSQMLRSLFKRRNIDRGFSP